MTLLRPDVAAVAPATWPRGLSRRHQKRREEFHGKPWRDLMAMYRIHVFHVYSMCFFLFFWLYCSWPFIHGDSTKVVPSITVEEFWMTQLIRKWWLHYQRWIGWYVTYIYLIGITGPHCYFRRKVMSSTCTPVCWSVRRRWMRPKNQLGLSENKVPPFHLIVNHPSLACITLYSLSYNVCII